MYAFEIGLGRTLDGQGILRVVPRGTYRLRSSSSLMMHVDPVRLHCVHSDSPSPTTHLILLSRQDAQAMDARCRTCCLEVDRVEAAGLETSSELDLSLSPSERDLRLPPEIAAAAIIRDVLTSAGEQLLPRVLGAAGTRRPFCGLSVGSAVLQRCRRQLREVLGRG